MEETVETQNECDINPEWLESMSKRENLLRNEIPHYPIFVEHIHDYISHPDYEDKFLKTIQTVGEVIAESERWGKIVTLTSGKNDEFPVNFDHLQLRELYVQDPSKIRYSVWEKHTWFKVFGTLERRGTRIVLEVTNFSPIEDIDATLDVMTFLTRIAQCTHEQFGTEMEKKEHLKDYWNTAKAKGLRIVEEQET